uniref:Acetyl-coenzyme A carboxylase carboxyl transferase subunit beta, chloroplastic n=1 Tax=Papuacedrus papuana TaxID=103977 RepID=A0A8F8XB56_9CONI|nr:acetyl-CoA carboxylase carboxyltransferase beta subunit [Papuacedrus papuana]
MKRINGFSFDENNENIGNDEIINRYLSQEQIDLVVDAISNSLSEDMMQNALMRKNFVPDNLIMAHFFFIINYFSRKEESNFFSWIATNFGWRLLEEIYWKVEYDINPDFFQSLILIYPGIESLYPKIEFLFINNFSELRDFLLKKEFSSTKEKKKKEREIERMIRKIKRGIRRRFFIEYAENLFKNEERKAEEEEEKYEKEQEEKEEEEEEKEEEEKHDKDSEYINETKPVDSEDSEYINETKPVDSEDSESMLEDSEYINETKPVDSEDSESMLEDSEDSESMEDSEYINETKPVDSEDSESINETKPVDSEDRWNSERFKHLWFLCENCDTLIYKIFFLEQKGVCSECGATLQLTSSERIQLLIDHGTWRPMNKTLSSMDVLEKKHITFDIKMVQKYSYVLYERICDCFFHNQFLKNWNALKILVKYNHTLGDIVNVVLEKKLIQYLNLDSKKTMSIIQDIIDTSLNTVQFVLFEIGKKIRNEFYWVRLLHPDPDLEKKDIDDIDISDTSISDLDTDIDVSIDTDISLSIATSLDDRDYSILTYLLDNSVNMKQRIFLQYEHLNKHFINLKLLLKSAQKLANLKEKLLSQDKLLKIASVFLMKIEVYFPEEKRKMRKIKKIFPFYPGNDPETNYFLWLRKHMSICLMETYLVFKKLKYWFQNRYSYLLEEFYRFGSDILVEYVKNQDHDDCDNIMMPNDDPLYWTNEYSREIEDLYKKEKAEAPAWDRLWAFCLLQLMKDFSATTIRILDNKEKFLFCKKKEETYIEDIEDTEDMEEEYPLTYASLTKEEKEYIDASVALIRSQLNLGKDDFLDTEEEQCYDDYNISYQKDTGLLDAIQTGIGQINGFTVAFGVMDFQFMGGSMGSVVGEKISRLIQYATEHFLPLILVCASGGARMQEGSYSLMQMNKIAAVLHTHQKEKSLLYISVLTSPTTGGVTASFGMLGDVTIVEPNAYIAFAGKRVIEQTLNQIVDDDDQISDSLFDFGMFDSMVPRALLKNVLSEIIDLYYV